MERVFRESSPTQGFLSIIRSHSLEIASWGKNWQSAKRAGVKQACPNKVMAHMPEGPCHTKNATVIVIHYGGSKTLRR